MTGRPRHLVLVAGLALALAAPGCGGQDDPAPAEGRTPDAATQSSQPASPFAEVARRAVRDVAGGRANLLDVRTPEEVAAGHAEGAAWIELDRLAAGRLPDLPKNEPLYVYCRTGNRAAEAVEILRAEGWSKAVNAGGLADWEAAGGATARGPIEQG